MREHGRDSPAKHERLIPARLHWNGDQPRSRQFSDIYHAPDGAAEVQRVFVEPQRLTERFARIQGVFTVGELGFGTGLNFAVIAQRLLEHASRDLRLHFVSVEKHPIAHSDFARLASRRSRALPIYTELMHLYPPALPGWHRRHFAGGRIMLSIYFGDGEAGLKDIAGRQSRTVDAWLLDGFAPDRNPELWSDSLWCAIAQLSGAGTTIATFSAVGSVRRALTDAGFAMRKVDQLPHKRHSLAGTFEPDRVAQSTSTRSVVVIGAGLAGVATARQLAERGITVSLIDAASAPPNRMAATLLHCRLLPDGGLPARQRALSYLYSSHWYASSPVVSPATGVLQFPGTTMNEQRLELAAAAYAHTGNWLVPVDATTASSLAGLPVRQGALFFPHGRTLNLQLLCQDLIQHPLIDFRTGVAARSIVTHPDRAMVTTTADTLYCDQIVLCTGVGTNNFDQARYLELLPVWGQIDRITPDQLPVIPMVGEGFMIPLASDYGIGATYEHKPWSNDAATEFNLRRFDHWWHSLTGRHAARRAVESLRGTRAVTSDRLPIVGALFDASGVRVPRLLVNTGHGSQGTVSAPFAAECIASEVVGEFAPCSRTEIETSTSLRFRNRQARRGARHGGRT